MASPINVGRNEGRLTNLRESGKKSAAFLHLSTIVVFPPIDPLGRLIRGIAKSRAA
jgi:hypothetical protein